MCPEERNVRDLKIKRITCEAHKPGGSGSSQDTCDGRSAAGPKVGAPRNRKERNEATIGVGPR